MPGYNILSGEDLVRKGVTRLEATLPELGLKDVVPNGSWLERKQIQAALEEKKHLIEVERIEKRGSLSQANWHDELSLAEVTQKVGGYWQFFGHNVGPILYVRPEEALFLMEINCLQLNYGGVKVSLQQAYSLLLCGDLTILKYKVYASLSRVGYKVFRHKSSPINMAQIAQLTEAKDFTLTVVTGQNKEKSNEISILCEDLKTGTDSDKANTSIVVDSGTNFINSSGHNKYSKNDADNSNNKMSEIYKNVIESYQNKAHKLKNRTLRQISFENINEFFTNIPELLGKCDVTLKAPEARFLPENMNLKGTYTVNLQNLHKKDVNRNNETSILGDEVNNSNNGNLQSDSNNIKIDNNISQTQTSVHTQTSIPNQNGTQSQNRIHSQHNNHTTNNDELRNNPQYMPVYYARPPNYNYYNVNMIFDNTLDHVYFPQYQCYGPQVYSEPSYNYCNQTGVQENRTQNPTIQRTRGNHLQRIKDLAGRLKILLSRGNVIKSHIRALKNLLKTYNSRYKTNLRLSSDFEILTEASVVAKIDLDLDDDEPQSKRQKIDNTFEENLNAIKEIALELRDMDINGKATASHCRSISRLLKTFNDSYNVEYYLTPAYEVLNRADSFPVSAPVTDCDAEPINNPEKAKKSKKLRNPYNILKRLSENQGASSSKSDFLSILKKNIQIENTGNNEAWLPNENNFERMEIPNEIDDPLFDSRKTQLLYEFIKVKPELLNWCQAKIAFLESLVESIVDFSQKPTHNNFDEDCLLSPECSNTKTVMEKLRIIKTNKDASSECRLHFDFDVYNRNVENYRKKNPPKPHFRVICLDESLEIPSASEIEALHSQYEDNIPIVFALVSSSSVSYLQVKPTEIPIYEPTTNP